MQATDPDKDNEQGDNSDRGEALQLHSQHEPATEARGLSPHGLAWHRALQDQLKWNISNDIAGKQNARYLLLLHLLILS